MINKKGKEIGTFDKYTIQCTQHAQSRMGLREIDSGKVVSAVLSIGINHLNLYHNMQLDVMVTDNPLGFPIDGAGEIATNVRRPIEFPIRRLSGNCRRVFFRSDCPG